MEIEYDGTMYAGWQRQPDRPSIKMEIERAIGLVLRQEIRVSGAGRTDAGVHALGQTANFRTGVAFDAGRLRWQINAVLPKDIAIKAVAPAADDFDARRSAIERTYSYLVLNREFPSPFWRRYSWWVSRQLDLGAMGMAAGALEGTHDFSAFTVAKEGSPVRRVRAVEIVPENDLCAGLVRIRISANAFLHHMVRLIVGSLVEVGAGKHPHGWTKEVLDSGDVRRAGPRAPAKGLWLEKVEYE